MMKQTRHQNDDLFDPASLIDSEEIERVLIGKRPEVKFRRRLHPLAPDSNRHRKVNDRESLLRRARAKAWGMPY